MRLFSISVAIALAIAAPLCAVPGPAQAAPNDALTASLQQAASRGALIYAYDQAAWHGTDDMLAKVPHPEQVIGGWIVDGPAAAPELVFFDQNKSDPHAVYVAEFRDSKLVSGRLLDPGDETRLSPQRVQLIKARQIGLDAFFAAKVDRCADRPYNTVVLPPVAPGAPTLIYVLTPQTDNDHIPFGGHYLVEVSADGKAAAPRPFTKSCLSMPAKGGKEKSEVMTITHLLDPIPTEIHVFSSFAAHLPVVVLTTQNKRMWMVEGNRIIEMDSSKIK